MVWYDFEKRKQASNKKDEMEKIDKDKDGILMRWYGKIWYYSEPQS